MKRKISTEQSKVVNLNNIVLRSTEQATKLKQLEAIPDDLLEQEEVYWQQRSSVYWLNFGDRNTKFLYAKDSARKANNKIKFLCTETGDTVSSKTDMVVVIQVYFANISKATAIDDSALHCTLNSIPSTITTDMNEELLKPFTATKVELSLHSMSLDKSLKIDRMSAIFYQQNWLVIGDLVTRVVLSMLNDGANMEDMNLTIKCNKAKDKMVKMELWP
uniref:Uncharacterized protein n=1 Tax=Cannabis sativa TaxID=3483 RepID=A0A803PL92_CANSA